MIAAEHAFISQRHVAPLVRAPGASRVVSRFELTGHLTYHYGVQVPPPIRAPKVEAAPVVDAVVTPPRPIGYKGAECRYCREPFAPRSGNTDDCPTCRSRIPKMLRTGPRVEEWSVRGSYLQRIRQLKADAVARHEAREQEKALAQRERHRAWADKRCARSVVQRAEHAGRAFLAGGSK
jgi:hypothetical protein